MEIATVSKKAQVIRVATRKSKLALWQANFVANLLKEKFPALSAHFIEMVTDGDRHQSTALNTMGGKSLFVKTLQEAVLKNKADIAVHSMKDMSVYETKGLSIGAVCKRADARDAFISPNYESILSLPQRAVVGTSSPRRACLLKAMRPDLVTTVLRGNVETRLLKCGNGEYAAIILAAAGLHRLGLSSKIRAYLSPELFTPAIAQGAIAIECRADDAAMREILLPLNDADTVHCVTAERSVNRILGGDCYTPIGAYATIKHDQLFLHATIGDREGKHVLKTSTVGHKDTAEALGKLAATTLIAQGAKKLL